MAACSYRIWQRGCWSSWWGGNWAIVLQRIFLSRANHNSVYKNCCTNLTWTIHSIEDTGQDSFNYPMSPWDHQGRQILSPESVCYHTLLCCPTEQLQLAKEQLALVWPRHFGMSEHPVLIWKHQETEIQSPASMVYFRNTLPPSTMATAS